MTYRPKNTQERILHRMKISRGHLEKIMEMVKEDHYCIDVLHQLNALEKALSGAGDMIMENHLKGCVADAIQKGKKEEVIGEVMQLLKKNND